MLSLYEILKASKTGIAPDMWTALAGMNWSGKDSGAEVKELTGIPPLSFTADGTPLLDYLISGNMSQSGTPTPENPITPSECGERTANLFDKTTITTGKWKSTSGDTTVAVGSYSDYIAVSSDTDYYVTAIVSRSSFYSGVCYDSAKTPISNIELPQNTTSGVIHTPANCAYIILNFSTNETNEVMLNSGSTALPYEPYGYKIPISSGGENLFDKELLVDGKGIFLDGSVVDDPNRTCTVNAIPVFDSSYVLSWVSDSVLAITATYNNGTLVNRVASLTSPTVIDTTGATELRVAFYKTNVQITKNDVSNIMLNRGSTALPYEPYIEPTETNIYLGEVQTTRRVKKLVLTGDETITTGSVIGQMRTSLTGAIDSLGYCTHYILKTVYGGDFPYIRIRINTLWIEISPDGYETKEEAVADFKAYLAQQYANGTPVTIWYVLATPTTGIVNEPLRKIGDYADTVSYEQAGVQIPTLHGNTVIDVETELKPSEIYIKYQE